MSKIVNSKTEEDVPEENNNLPIIAKVAEKEEVPKVQVEKLSPPTLEEVKVKEKEVREENNKPTDAQVLKVDKKVPSSASQYKDAISSPRMMTQEIPKELAEVDVIHVVSPSEFVISRTAEVRYDNTSELNTESFLSSILRTSSTSSY